MAPRKSEVEAVRRFNRFYTKRIGVLRRGFLDSPFSLSEARILYEIAHGGGVTSSQIASTLDLDAGYLSRTLRQFEHRGLIIRQTSRDDARASHLRLTPAGRKAFTPLDRRSAADAGAMLRKLAEPGRARLIDAMRAIETLVSPEPAPAPVIAIRTHRPGDLGWMVHRHAVLYAQEYGWLGTFEALVADIAARFLQNYDAARERCWIAEVDGRPSGSVMCVNAGNGVSQLRLLLVEPEARGLGLGARLVAECVAFARATGYKKMILWTQSNLDAAQHVYQKAGFVITKEERHSHFGYALTGREWELYL